MSALSELLKGWQDYHRELYDEYQRSIRFNEHAESLRLRSKMSVLSACIHDLETIIFRTPESERNPERHHHLCLENLGDGKGTRSFTKP